jgi:hypothetical protein
MTILLIFILALTRLFIFTKVVYLLFMTQMYPEIHPITELIWWICFLVFDIWSLMIINNNVEKEKKE